MCQWNNATDRYSWRTTEIRFTTTATAKSWRSGTVSISSSSPWQLSDTETYHQALFSAKCSPSSSLSPRLYVHALYDSPCVHTPLMATFPFVLLNYARRRLRSSSSNKMMVPRTRLKMVGDRANSALRQLASGKTFRQPLPARHPSLPSRDT